MPLGPTDEARADDDLVSLSTLVRRWWPAMVVAMVLGAMAGHAAIRATDTVYGIKVQVLVGPVVPDADVLKGAADLARTYGEIVESRRVVEEAVLAAGVEVDPNDVVVAAQAGRGSATVDIQVQAPSATATPQIAAEIVESLRSIVRESRRGASIVAPADPADDAIDPQIVLSGSTVTLIDDGGGGSRQTLTPAVGAVVGAFAATFLLGALALTIESRRRARPTADLLIQHLGRDLGRLDLPPSLPDLVRRRPRFRLSTDDVAAHDATLTAEALLAGHSIHECIVVFVAAPSAKASYATSVLQLAAALERPTTVLDPARRIATALALGTSTAPDRPGHIVAHGRPVAELRIPPADLRVEIVDTLRSEHRPDQAGRIVLIAAPADSSFPDWRIWASAADVAVVLTTWDQRRETPLVDILSRLRSVGVPVAGGISVRQRWTSGRSSAARHAELDHPRGPAEGLEDESSAGLVRS